MLPVSMEEVSSTSENRKEKISEKDGHTVDSKSTKEGSRSRQSSSSKENAGTLYQIYEELSVATDKLALIDQYKYLLKVVHNADKEKGLAAQFITRFAEYFPSLGMETANALFDLCEDENSSIRRQVVKDLVTVCKKLPNLVPTVADVFSQLLQAIDAVELTTVQDSLKSLFYINPELAMEGILAQIKTGDSLVRAECFKFLQAKFRSLGPEVRSPSFEKSLLKGVCKVMRSLETRDQFMDIMEIVNSTKLAKTAEGRRAIIEMIEVMLDIKNDFRGADDAEAIAKLLVAADYVFPFFNEKNSSATLFTYFCTRVLPKVRTLVDRNENAYFSILKMAVELALYFGKMDEKIIKICLRSLLEVAESFLYKAPAILPEKMPDYQFSFLESILYLIRKVGRIQPAVMSEILKQETQFRSKLGYLLQALLPYKSKLRNDLQSLPREELGNEFKRITCLRVLANITTICKELYFTNEPATAASQEKLRLSWKASQLSSSASPSPILPPSSSRKVTIVKRNALDEQPKIYQPPGGKFSGITGNYDESSGSRTNRRRSGVSGRSASGMERFAIKRSIRR